MAAKRRGGARVVTSFVRIKDDLEPGKVRCNGCSQIVGLNPTGRTRAHRTPAGEPCAYQVVYAPPVHLDELPEVVLPPQRRDRRSERGQSHDRREPGTSRIETGSECRDCGRWLPGERSLCGRCANHQAKQSRRSPSK